MKRTSVVLLLVILACMTPGLGAQTIQNAIEIDPVTVTAKGEDRAYRIMRNAIAAAPRYLDQVEEYSAEVYLKGSVEPVKISRVVRGMAGRGTLKDFQVGTSYVLESVSQIDFTAPDTYSQRVIKEMNSIPGLDDGEDTAMKLVNVNIYNPNALGPIVSPLSPGAFNHYRFRYEGYIEQAGRIINKIRVSPMRGNQQLLTGYLYIAEDYWNVHGFDLAGEMRMMVGVEFRLKAEYGEAAAGVWLPVSHDIRLDISAMGSKIKVEYVSRVEYTRIVENSSAGVPRVAAEPLQEEELTNRDAYRAARKVRREVQRRESLDVSERYEDHYEVAVDSLAKVVDPDFWDGRRPIELTPQELKGYEQVGVVATGRSDSTAVGTGKRSFLGGVLVGGPTLKLGKKGGELVYRGIVPSKAGFNTVDGFYVGLAPVEYVKRFREGVRLEITPQVVWAINRHKAMWTLDAKMEYAPMRRGMLTLSGGSTSRDFDPAGAILPAENTIAGLVFRRGYMKLYEDNFVELANNIELANGLTLDVGLKYSRRKGLENHSDYSFFYRGSREYTPNIAMADHTAAVMRVGLVWTPRQYYRVRDGRKQMLGSHWPTLSATWEKGVKGIGGSTTDFDHLRASVKQTIAISGPMQRLSYNVSGGWFPNRKSMSLADAKHFRTGDIPLTNRTLTATNAFQLLPYYRYSTSESYLEAHVTYSARFLLVKLIPWFSNRLWQEGVQLNYLTTKNLQNYTELGYTIGLVWQAGVFVGFEGVKFRSFGAKISFPLNIGRESAEISIPL